MDRRTFIKASGVVAAAGLTGSCGQVAQKIIPYVIPPDEGINPVEGFWYATSCRMCEAGCGIAVRTVEGRAKKIEGNPNHPINAGGVCARGQAALQQLYHPERLKTPLKRKGPKGSNSFEPVSWDEAMEMLADNMKKAKENGGAFVLASDPNDITSGIAARILDSIGSKNSFAVPDITGRENYVEASAMLNASPALPYYDISHAHFTLMLGADVLESGFSPVHYGHRYGEMRRGDPTHRGYMVYAGPRVSMTAAVADKFIAVNAGQLGLLALGIASEVLQIALDKNLLLSVPKATMGLWLNALEPHRAENVTGDTSVSVKDIKMLAGNFVEDAPAVAIPGDDVAAHSNGLKSLRAVEFLNMLSREIAREKGALKPIRLPVAEHDLYEAMRSHLGLPKTARHYATLKAILEKADKTHMGIILHTDPAHSTPASLKASEALSKPKFLAVFGHFLNDTTQYADLVLPDHHFLESWSAQVPEYPQSIPTFNMQQPVVNPMYDSRPAGDVLLAAAEKAGIQTETQNTQEMIKKTISLFRARWPEIQPGFDDTQAWEFLLKRGGWWSENMQEEVEPPPTTDMMWESAKKLTAEKPEFDGGDDFKFHLHPYYTQNIWDGRMANLPWMLEMPEPMTTRMWGAWVELNPKTAEKMSIEEGDVIKIESKSGTIELPAYIYPGIGPETVAVPFGFGHKSFGKYATGRGANAMDLVGSLAEKKNGSPAWRSVRVRIAKTGKKIETARAAHPEGEYVGEVFQL